MALSDFTGPDYIDAWTEDLDRRWPERAAMAECVVRTLVGWREEWRGERRDGGGAALDGERSGAEESRGRALGSGAKKRPEVIRLLELGVGAGGLAKAVLDSLADRTGAESPGTVEYTGIEIEPALVDHVGERLGSAGHQFARLIRADLRGDAWTRGLGLFDAVFTLQTIHDLGGIEALEAVYRQAHGLLAPGGILVNADFVVPFEKDDPDRPRRLPVETHQRLLNGLGFVDMKCEQQLGKMACMAIRRP